MSTTARHPGNVLYYGDNLDILRRYVDAESVDLVYLDPPFNSNATYNVLFAEHNGSRAAAQIRAFEDTWRWDQQAAAAYHQAVESGDGTVSRAMQAFRMLLGESDMMAYLAMMAPRLVELRRVLKPTGSIYLHCDPTASHYLKALLDAVFGANRLRNEIIWKRTAAHSSANRCGPVHDVILYYALSDGAVWNPQYTAHSEEHLASKYRFTDGSGRRYCRDNLTAAGVRHGSSGNTWHGIDPTARGYHWKFRVERLEELDAEGQIYWPPKGGMPRFKRYLDQMRGVPLQDVWTDVFPINSQARERLGFPTQKPTALLERIIRASSNPGDTVLDPFCGCGTAIAAAQELKRRWIGIDITHLAITLIKHRLRDAYGAAAKFETIGEPVSLPDAQALAQEDPYQFQWWALGLVGARPTEQKKGADKGIDGRLYFHDERAVEKTKQIVFSVKAGHLALTHVRDLRGVLEREKAEIGVLISLEDPTPAMRAEAASAGFYSVIGWAGRFPRLQLLTVGELLEGKQVSMPPSQDLRTFKKANRRKRKDDENGSLFGPASSHQP